MRPYATAKPRALEPQSLVNLVSWQPGQSGNPAGRPRGSRSKLTEQFIAVLHDDFLKHGPDVVAKVRENQPAQYLAVISAIIPKQQQKVESPFSDLSDIELDQLEMLLASMRATTVSELEPKPLARGTKKNETTSHRHVAAVLEASAGTADTSKGPAGACNSASDVCSDANGSR